MRLPVPSRTAFLLLSLAVFAAPALRAQTPELSFLGRYEAGLFDEGAAEIAAYDSASCRLFFVNAQANQVVALDVRDPALPVEAFSIDLSPYGAQANSVAVAGGVVAIAVEAEPKTAPGVVVFFTSGGQPLGQAPVGALPDALTFTPDGRTVVVANEGEPDDDYVVDPEGSVSLIALPSLRVTTVGFSDFNAGGPRVGELPPGVRIFGPGATVAQDLEPEYPAVSPDGAKAFVSLQENNALAVIDVATVHVDAIVAFGTKHHALPANALDASDRDGGIHIQPWPVQGLYLPDALAAYAVGGQTYVVTANEGDARDYDGFGEEERVGDLALDPAAFPDAATLQADENLGRLNVTTANGDLDGDGDYDVLYAFGARSFSIWTPDGALVYDSGDAFEQITASLLPSAFNSDNAENDSFDSRSDNKGPEPEGVTLGLVDGHHYAFVGLERIGGIVVYDVTDPSAPVFVDYTNSRDFTGDPEAGTAGDLGPEGLVFIPAAESPTGVPLLAVAHEVSGSVAFYRFAPPSPVNVTAAPVDPPVEIPAGGGNFSFAVTLENTTAETQTVEVWSAVRRPDGRLIARVAGPRSETLAPGQVAVYAVTQAVPGSAPAGEYTYSVRVGTFPSLVLDSQSFSFTKAAGAAATTAEAMEAGWTAVIADGAPPTASVHASYATASLEAESYPNPFSAVATIRYTLASTEDVRLVVYDMLGRELSCLVDEAQEPGTYTTRFDAAGLPSGVYVYELRTSSGVRRGRLSLVK